MGTRANDVLPAEDAIRGGSGQRGERGFVDRFLLAVARDQPLHPWRVLVICVAVEAAFLTVIAATHDSAHMLGIPGSLVALTVVIAAVLAGPLVGSATALAAGPIFYATVGGFGARSEAITIVISTFIWIAGGLLAGMLARALREQAERHREAAMALSAAQAAREAQAEVAQVHEALEESLLPALPVRHPMFSIATAYHPGEDRLQLGGDFLDIAALPDGGLAIIIGDVAGHGPHAAALGAGLRAGWQALIRSRVNPSTVLNSLSELVASSRPAGETFATACFAWLDARGRHLQLLSAGHPAPFLTGEQPMSVPVDALAPLGVQPAGTWPTTAIELPEEWGLLFYTDGLIEGRCAPGSAERYGVERLAARLAGVASIASDGVLTGIVDEIRRANGSPLVDDVAAIAVTPR